MQAKTETEAAAVNSKTITASSLLHVDLLAGVSSLGWAVGTLYASELAQLVSTEAATAFGLAALVRWTASFKKK